ncbi:hypothetical protein LCGC14_0208360 [marine sediment metagenome]|uniref:Uncharacterized protein n=1 Tax=marine sediment metagenome TaxID=412755 RepID=A0A0F9UGL2_9ZZZZ
MNGSRLREHRAPKVSFESWFLLFGLISGLLILGPIAVKGQEYKPFVKDTGIIVAGAELCFSSDLGAPSVKQLNLWQRLITEHEAYQRGGAPMNEEEAVLAQAMADNNVCATTVEYYRVIITQDTEGYVLARYDETYGFEDGSFIVAKRDILLDTVLR